MKKNCNVRAKLILSFCTDISILRSLSNGRGNSKYIAINIILVHMSGFIVLTNKQ